MDGFQEYPKWITTGAGERKIVASADEEAQEAGVASKMPAPGTFHGELPARAHAEPANELLRAPDPRAALLADAERAGVKVDRRWGDDRIRAEIEKAAK